MKIAKAEMMIRKPVSKVFEAFIDPEITKMFWFSKGSGKLAAGNNVNWIWEMYDLTVPVKVISISQNKEIEIEWGTGENVSTAKWTFQEVSEDKTFVSVSNYNFLGSEEEVTSKVIDSTGGFTMVLAGAKAWLEHGVQLNLVADKVVN